MDKKSEFPLIAKASLFCIGLYSLISMLYLGQGIILPLLFAIIFSIILHPVVNFLVRKKVNRLAAIILTVILFLLVIGGLGLFIFSQATHFSESLPTLIDKFSALIDQTITWISGYFNVSVPKINAWIMKARTGLIDSGGKAVGQTLAVVGNSVVLLILFPVYIFMILFYQPLLLEFLHKLFGRNHHEMVASIIPEIKILIQRYLVGLLIEVVIMAVLYTTGLLIMGIQYAIVLGVLGAMLNIIPYIGPLIAAAMPMIVSLVTKSSPWFALVVLGVLLFIQFIDNNYIFPRIVASRVKINALITIVMVICFSALWGIPGMILAVPLTAIVKLIFDHIEPLKPWGYLLGDTMPEKKTEKTAKEKKPA